MFIHNQQHVIYGISEQLAAISPKWQNHLALDMIQAEKGGVFLMFWGPLLYFYSQKHSFKWIHNTGSSGPYINTWRTTDEFLRLSRFLFQSLTTLNFHNKTLLFLLSPVLQQVWEKSLFVESSH